MANILSKLFRWRDRRKVDKPVSEDRRKPRGTIKDADESLNSALDRLEQTVRLKRSDFIREEKIIAVNDAQQVVLFRTFSEICRFRGSDALRVRLCRHPRHEDAANSALARCEESSCPLILEAVKGAA